MKHIFYLMAIVFIFNELSWIINPKERVSKTKLLQEQFLIYKDKSWDECTKGYKSLLLNTGLKSVLVTVWLFVGLLTFNWVAFLTILIFNIAIVAPISNPFKYNKTYLLIHWVNSIIGFAFGVFVIINSYHLKIDLYKLLLTLINK